MKTHSSGALPAFPPPLPLPSRSLLPPGSSVFALLAYRENRENPSPVAPASSLNPFPLHGFVTLDIESTNSQSGKWPDADGKYWWRIELRNGDIVTDFYWMEDKERGYPGTDDKGNQYWCYKIGYRDEPPLAGFSQEPDYSQGKFAGKSGLYYYNFTFDDRFCDIIRECEALYDLEYLDDLEKNNPELYRQEITDLEDKNDPNGILPRHQERQQQATVHAAAVADTTTEDVEASASSQPAASTLDNLSQRLTTLELRVNDISSADKRADRRRERRNTRSRQHMEPLAIESSVNQGQVQALSEQALAQQFEQAQQHAAMMLQRQLTALVSEQEAKAEQQRHDLETNIARIEADIKQCRSSSSSSSSDTQAAVNTTLHQLRQRQQQLTQVLRPLHEEQQQRLVRQQQLAYITQHPDESIRTFYDVVFRRLNRLFLMLSIASTQAFVLRADTWQYLIFGGEQLLLGVAEQLIDVLALTGEAVPLVSPGIKLLAGMAKGLYSKYRDYQIKVGVASLNGSLVNNEYLAQEVAMLLAYRYEPALTGLVCSSAQDEQGNRAISADSIDMLGLYAAGKIIKGLLSGKVPTGLSGDDAISALLQLVSEEKLAEHTIMIRVGFVEQAMVLPGIRQRLTRENGQTICAESLLRQKTGIMLRDENPLTQTITVYLKRPSRQDVSDDDVARYGYRWPTAKEITSNQFVSHHQPIVMLAKQPGAEDRLTSSSTDNEQPDEQQQANGESYPAQVIIAAERIASLPTIALVGDSEAAKQRAKEVEEQKARAKKQAHREKARVKAEERAKKKVAKKDKKGKSKDVKSKGSQIRPSVSSSAIPTSASMPSTISVDNRDDTMADALSTLSCSDSVHYTHGDNEISQLDATQDDIRLESDETWLQDTALTTYIDNGQLSQLSPSTTMSITQQQLDKMSEHTQQQARTLAQQQENLSTLSLTQNRNDAQLQKANERIVELAATLQHINEEKSSNADEMTHVKEEMQQAIDQQRKEYEQKLEQITTAHQEQLTHANTQLAALSNQVAQANDTIKALQNALGILSTKLLVIEHHQQTSPSTSHAQQIGQFGMLAPGNQPHEGGTSVSQSSPASSSQAGLNNT